MGAGGLCTLYKNILCNFVKKPDKTIQKADFTSRALFKPAFPVYNNHIKQTGYRGHCIPADMEPEIEERQVCVESQALSARADMQEILQKMTDRIAHRGPDGEGHYIDGPAALGHRRLSIIDLEGGRQPMFNEDGSLAVVFNGEIYNFQPLREELIAAGHTFATRCDTEVLLHGYEQWGRELLTRLRGMFTFALWDKNSRTLFCARDHFGIKPLYYYIAPETGTLLFGSEIKCFWTIRSSKRS